MLDVKVERSEVNLALLDAEIREALGANAYGLSFDGNEVIVHLDDQTTDNQVAQARQIVKQHNSAQLTSSQQATIVRQAQLEALRRSDAAVPIDAADYEAEPAQLQKLVHKIAWLELEIAALRGI